MGFRSVIFALVALLPLTSSAQRAFTLNSSTSAQIWPTDRGVVRTFANNAARTAAVPDFVGQLAYQTDTATHYKSTGTSAGNWSANIKLDQLAIVNGTGFAISLTSPGTSANLTIGLPSASGTLVTEGGSATLTGKIIALGSNTISGSVSDFNSALSGADFYTSGGTDVAVADGGTGKSSLPGFSAQGNGGANQSVSSGVFTKVTCFGTEIFDDGTWFTSNTGTVPVTGYYLVGAKVTLNNPTSGTRIAIEIYKNGSSLVRVADDKMTGTSTQSKNGAMVVSLESGDTIDVYVYHDKGSNADVENNSGTSFFAKLIP